MNDATRKKAIAVLDKIGPVEQFGSQLVWHRRAWRWYVDNNVWSQRVSDSTAEALILRRLLEYQDGRNTEWRLAWSVFAVGVNAQRLPEQPGNTYHATMFDAIVDNMHREFCEKDGEA